MVQCSTARHPTSPTTSSPTEQGHDLDLDLNGQRQPVLTRTAARTPVSRTLTDALPLALTGTSRRTSPAVCLSAAIEPVRVVDAALSASSHTVVDALRLSRGRT